MTQYTYEPFEPHIYAGKMFRVTPEQGNPFLVSVAKDESEIPALVEYHLNPPPPVPYPPSPPPPQVSQDDLIDTIKQLKARIEALEAK